MSAVPPCNTYAHAQAASRTMHLAASHQRVGCVFRRIQIVNKSFNFLVVKPQTVVKTANISLK